MRCDFCGAPIGEFLMLNVDLWPRVSKGRVGNIMCIPCIKRTLGREPTDHDQRRPWWPYQRRLMIGKRLQLEAQWRDRVTVLDDGDIPF